MELTEKFKKESKDKYASVVYSDSDGNTHYSDEYVEWLEELVKKLTIPVVVNTFSCDGCIYNNTTNDMACGTCGVGYVNKKLAT